jgi:hypothetical protein
MIIQTSRRVRDAMQRRGPLSQYFNGRGARSVRNRMLAGTYRGNYILRGALSPNSKPLVRIKWEEKEVNNLPNNNIALNRFSNGAKAVKIDRFRYVTPNTVQKLAGGVPIRSLFMEKNKQKVLFQNPFTRQPVRRDDLKFITLKKKK